MSRWDALKSEGHREPTKKSVPRHVAPTSRWDDLLTGLRQNSKSVRVEDISRVIKEENIPPKPLGEAVALILLKLPSPRLELANPILATRQAVLTNQQVQDCFSVLCQMSTSLPNVTEALCYFSLSFREQLPAEEVASQLVGSKLLVVLECHEQHQAHVLLVLETLESFLSDDRHVSALLNPLTIDVSNQGEEKTLTNPLKSRILTALQAHLELEDFYRAACQCLTVALSRGSSNEESSSCLDLKSLQRVVTDRLQEEPHQSSALKLLQATLHAYPGSSAALANVLLGPGPRLEQNVRTSCSCRPNSPLISLLHTSNSDLVAQTIRDFLKTLPLHLWLNRSMRTRHRGQQNFGQRVTDALEQLICVVQCRIVRIRSGVASLSSLWRLSTVILMNIPYTEDSVLFRASVELLSTIGSVIMTCNNRASSLAAEVLVESMGGQTRPEGGQTAMSLPTQKWLSDDSSVALIEFLLQSLESRSDASSSAAHIMGAILQTSPETILNDRTKWSRTQMIIGFRTRHMSNTVRREGILLLEKLLSGRHDHIERIDLGLSDQVASFALRVVTLSRDDSDASARTSTMKCYGAFLGKDWIQMTRDTHGDQSGFMSHVQAILAKCVPVHSVGDNQRGESKASARAAACKAVGDICMHCLSNDSDTDIIDKLAASWFWIAASETLVQSLQDSNASVRSMALFGLGNLGYTMRNSKGIEPSISPTVLLSVFRGVSACFEDQNDKVTGNTIRTIGHVSYLAFQVPASATAIVDAWDKATAYKKVLEWLRSKVNAALPQQKESPTVTVLSWKQRSAAKKHGWGACHSLALVLNCDQALSDTNISHSRNALKALLQCIILIDSINKKVAAAATAAVRKISQERLLALSDASGVTGYAMRTCMLVVQGQDTSRASHPRMQSETELLLKHLLQAASIYDVCCMLKGEEISDIHLDFLYTWMVDNDLAAESFESLALALQRRDLADDVAWQQRFASRALQRQRKEQPDVFNGNVEQEEDVHAYGASEYNEEDEEL